VSKLSYGSLWDEDVKGHTQGRGHSFLLGIGLWWDGSGKQPSNRMLDGYKDEDELQEAVGSDPEAFAIEQQGLGEAVLGFGRQHQVGPDGERRLDRPDLGWPGLSLKKEGKPVNYTGSEGRRHRLARRSGADEGRQEHRPGL
jgi:spermidine/putrescine transport system substrate-binding protein